MQSRRRSSETPFVRTKVALYFVSLLLGNLVQTVGGLLNIAWIVENRVYVGPVCTIQGALKQIGNVRIFSLYRDEWVLTPLVVSDWSSDFHFCNRRPYLQPTLPSSPMVGSHVQHRPRRRMGPPSTRNMHRQLYPSGTKGERSIIWNL